MKRIWTLTLILTLISAISISFNAVAWGHPPPPPHHHHGAHPVDRVKALRVLNVTRDYIFRAKRVAHRYQQHELQRAFAIQADARTAYQHWEHNRAIRLSLHAREIAQSIIARAGRRPPPPPPPPPPRHRHHHHHHGGESSIHINLRL